MDFYSMSLLGGLATTLAFLLLLYYKHLRKARLRLSRASLSERLSVATGWIGLTGVRPTMEDGHVINLVLRYEADNLEGSRTIRDNDRPSVCLFGIFDGHSGTACSNYLKTNLQSLISKERDVFYGATSEDVCEALCRVFLAADTSFANAFFAANKKYGDRSSVAIPTPGSTACIGILNEDKLYVANVGDSRAVLGRVNNADLSVFHVDLSKDHKPSRSSETMRILSAGGSVQASHISSNKCLVSVGPLRVWPGGLSVSRGIGDFSLKANKELEKQGVRGDLISPYPEIRYTTTSICDQFLVIACDGVYDVLSSEEVVKFIYANRPVIMIDEMKSVIEYNTGTIVSPHVDEESSDLLLDQHNNNPHQAQSISKSSYQELLRKTQRGVRRLLFLARRFFTALYHKLLSTPLNLSEVSMELAGGEEPTDNLEFNDEMIQQIDCLCAQKLAEKLAHLALEREATDNISVIVVLFRWKGITPNTIGGWRSYNQVLTMHSVREDGDLRPPIPDFSDESSCIARNHADDVILWISKDDPSYPFVRGK
ncbi:Protein phosphatase 2C [Giardia duodenalis]|uniref:Ser/Thr phosphatase 2C, putative n=2 Tax=Giardia intestinalis TaxID=5741 RepID=C6LZX0_GIAIB|nr:Ser/Thr phosphatase 2C, putative [Giardia intestinalis ATCC 50581]ESU44621.1 Protein phosphatase 2C [Giardia intestinalis]